MELQPEKPFDPFRIGSASPSVDFYRTEVAFCLWRITGDTRKTLPILLDALNRGTRPSAIYERVARMGPIARDALPEILRFELGQRYPNLALFRKAFTVDRGTAMKTDLSK